jgi:hypothetical protein
VKRRARGLNQLYRLNGRDFPNGHFQFFGVISETHVAWPARVIDRGRAVQGRVCSYSKSERKT